MKTIYLLLIVIMITISCFAQSTIDSAFHFTFDYHKPLNYNPPIGTQAPVGPDYGCLTSHTNRPIWFYINVCGADTGTPSAMLNVLTNIYPGPGQLGLILWGPFDDTINIASKLTASNIDTCILHLVSPGTAFIILHHLQYPKIYYGMFTMDDKVQFVQMVGGASWWCDDRCGICNGRVANYKQDICMVTLDSTTQKNMIIWDKKNNFEVASFNIYREGNVAGLFDSIGNVPVNDNGVFIDYGVNPNQQSYKYRISGLDSCSHTELKYNSNSIYDSALIHETIHLQASTGLNNEINLSWNAYEGFIYGTFYIYRGSSADSLVIIDSVSATTYSYTDYNAQPGLNFYKVNVRKPDGCSPDGGTTVYHEARSNNPYTTSVGINEIHHTFYFKVSPNPVNDEFNIYFSKYINGGEIDLFNVLGDKVYSEHFNGVQTLINYKLSEGAYFVRIFDGNESLIQKIIIQ